MNSNNRTIKTLESGANAFKTPFIHVDLDKVLFPNGVEGEYAVLSSSQPFGTIIVPMIAFRGQAYFGLVNQYRYPIKAFTLEFPRGGADDLEEGSAVIEITEEIGQAPQRMSKLGIIHNDTGIASTKSAVWLAIMDASNMDSGHIEEITGLEPQWISEGQLDGLLTSGQVTCGMTLAAYALFKLNRNKYGSILNEMF